ncbi:MAG: cytochrome c [Polyangiaceae bacterium]|nr:cytochrome c [Polyangiaceae bacterium]
MRRLSPKRAAARVGAAALFSLAALSACSADGDRPGYIVLPGMVDSVPLDPYDRDPINKDMQAARLPPEGTVAEGWDVFDYGPGPQEAERAGREVKSPFEPTPKDLERGKWVYTTFCQICHGAQGQGDGPIIGRYPNPPNLMADRAKNLPDGHLFHIITHGQGIMPAYDVQVLPEDRWRVVMYVRSLQEAKQ